VPDLVAKINEVNTIVWAALLVQLGADLTCICLHDAALMLVGTRGGIVLGLVGRYQTSVDFTV
jgi:hypothetical protein